MKSQRKPSPLHRTAATVCRRLRALRLRRWRAELERTDPRSPRASELVKLIEGGVGWQGPTK